MTALSWVSSSLSSNGPSDDPPGVMREKVALSCPDVLLLPLHLLREFRFELLAELVQFRSALVRLPR
jgi:hypothetical protein